MFEETLAVNVVGYNSWYTNFISPLTPMSNPLLPQDETYAFQDGQLIEGSGFLLTYFNFGEATVRGLGVGLEYAPTERLSLTGSLSLIELSNFDQGDADRDLLLNVPNTKVKGSVMIHDVGTENAFVSVQGRWKSAYEFHSGYWDSSEFYDDGEVPGRFAANLTVGFTVPNTNLNVKASATNLFDTETPDVLGAPETGRLLWVSAIYKFQGLNF